MQRQPDAASCMNNKLKQEFHSGACFFASFFCLIDQKKKKKKRKNVAFLEMAAFGNGADGADAKSRMKF
jgi:hypothetical protein